MKNILNNLHKLIIENKESIITYSQILLLIFTAYLIWQTNKIINDSRESTKNQSEFIESMKKNISGINDEMDSIKGKITEIPSQVSEIGNSLKSVNELIQEYKNRSEKELDKTANLTMSLRTYSQGDEEAKLIVKNIGSANTTIEQIKFIIPEEFYQLTQISGPYYCDVYGDRINKTVILNFNNIKFNVPSKQSREIEFSIYLKFEGTFTVKYKILHTYGLSEGNFRLTGKP